MNTDGTTGLIAVNASTAMREMAHATITVDEPADLHPLIDELLGSLRSLVQIADQLAHAHMHHRGRARSETGDAALGAWEADNATWSLVRARELLDAAEGAVDLASQSARQLAWVPAEQGERWLNVVFLEGADAIRVLDTIERSGAPAAIWHLAQWDLGDETTEAALVNGYVYEGIPTCPTDRTAEDHASGYALIHNPMLGYVSLLRRFPGHPDGAVIPAQPIGRAAIEAQTRSLPARMLARPPATRTAVRSVGL
ncbi:hypothetical protein [Microbacterium pumilum]|uniref:DUF222 domain-containing protein n=1 Tax=Microbacterium pumilum TaxID=344165 RepID=A0ABN2T1J9_9MICO